MGRSRFLLVALVPCIALAAETTPVTNWVGTAPSGACKGERTVVVPSTGQHYACISGTWSAVGGGGGGGGAPTTATSMNIVTANAGQRVFMGLKDATAVLNVSADPNAALDTVYFGANAADTNLSICSNDNVGTATCTTLGASFPAKTANSAYDVAFWAAPNASSIGYSIRHVVSGATATGTVSSDLPRNTVQLGFDLNINSGTSAAITTMQFGGTCYIANP